MMVEYVSNSSYSVKVDQPKWVPSKTKYLDTFFAEHMQLMGAMCNNPAVNGDQVEMFVRGLLSLITPKEKRADCIKDVEESYKKYCEKRARLRNITDVNQLNDTDQSHCYKLAWLDVLGEIVDIQSKTYHVEGNEQLIGVFGMMGETPDGNPAMLMSMESLLKLVDKKQLKPISVKGSESLTNGTVEEEATENVS